MYKIGDLVIFHGLIYELKPWKSCFECSMGYDDELNKKMEKKTQTRAFAVADVYDKTNQDKDLVAMIDNYTEEDEAEIAEVLRLERLTDCYGSDDLPF